MCRRKSATLHPSQRKDLTIVTGSVEGSRVTKICRRRMEGTIADISYCGTRYSISQVLPPCSLERCSCFVTAKSGPQVEPSSSYPSAVHNRSGGKPRRCNNMWRWSKMPVTRINLSVVRRPPYSIGRRFRCASIFMRLRAAPRRATNTI